MSTLSLRFLKQRLEREAPAFSWNCEPVHATRSLLGTSLPEEIQVRASKGGVPIGNPFYLSGECLKRWGLDASVAMICNELHPGLRAFVDWDRLAD